MLGVHFLPNSMSIIKIAIHDNFFETGISSLTLTEIHQRVDETWPGLVDITDMFEHQTIAELARFIDEKNQSNG